MKLTMVELTVRDPASVLAWYRDVLGLPVLLRDDAHGFVLLEAGGETRLAIKQGDPHPGTTRLAFEVADVEAETARLAAHGVTPEAPLKMSPEGYRRVLLRDPDGHRLSLYDWRGQITKSTGDAG